MNSFKVVITTTANEVIKYMITAKNEAFAEFSARIRFDKVYKGETLKTVDVTPMN